MDNLNQIKQQYFMHPDTPDDEVLVRVNDIEMAIHKETITDINYIPKTLEEARQHPLWVEGHIPAMKLLIMALVGYHLWWMFMWVAESIDELPFDILASIVLIEASVLILLIYQLKTKSSNFIKRVLIIELLYVPVYIALVHYPTQVCLYNRFDMSDVVGPTLILVGFVACIGLWWLPYIFFSKKYKVNYTKYPK